MPADSSAIDPIDPVGPLADEFLARHRRGERPAVADYAERFPELAERIKQLFPMLLAMEEAGADPSLGATVAPAGPANEWAGPSLDRVAGYRLLREIGRGGMGIVYEAEQTALGRHVALKVLPLHAARDGTGLERFRQEARAAARLHHTNIVPVYEVGQDGDAYFYAMQFIPGQPLDQVLDEVRKLRAASGGVDPRRLPEASAAHSLLAGLPAPAPDERRGSTPPLAAPPAADDRPARGAYYKSVARLGVQVAQALDYAHKEGVIHRDVKPSNLLLDSDGRVWVTDFGLAKTDGSALTQTGDIVGTLRYMAPERFNGWSDPRSDVYALGLTLYEMLALRPAFDAPEQGRLMQQVLHEDPPAPRRADPHVPRDLETVIAKAIDKEPSRRYQTAADFGADLQRFLDDHPILARRTGLAERAWRWAKRNPALAATTMLTFLALLIATVVSALFAAAQADSAASQKALSAKLQEALGQSQELAEERDKALKETRGHAARSAVDRAQGLLERGHLHEAMLWLARALELTPGEDGDLQRFARLSLASLEADAPVLKSMWAPRHAGHVGAAAFSADGTVLLTGGDAPEAAGEARLWDAFTGRPLTEPLPHRGGVTHVAISPDGEALLTVSAPQPGQSEVRLWEAATGRPLTEPLPHPGPVTAVVCGPHGKTFFTVSGAAPEAAEARFWQVEGPTASAHPLAHAGAVTALAISPDGKTALTAWRSPTASEGGLRLWDALTGAAATSKAVGAVVTAAALDADGIVWAGEDSGGALFWDPARDHLQAWLYEARGPVRGLALSPAGDFALVISENAQTGRLEGRLWDRFPGQRLGIALPHEAPAARAAFSPDGRHLLTWEPNRPVRAWDLGAAARWFAALPVSASPAGGGLLGRAVQYGADGSSLLVAGVGAQQGAAQQWDAGTATARAEPLYTRLPDSLAALSPDGRTALVAGSRGARPWDVAAGKPTGPRLTLGVAPSQACFSPDGKTVALANAQQLRLADVASGKMSDLSFPVPGALTDLRFSPDGRSLWVLTPTSVRCFDAASGREARPNLAVRGRGLHQLVPSPGGRLLAVLDHTGVGLWDTETGHRADFSIPRLAARAGVVFTPDGKGLLAGDPSGSGAQLWDVALGKPVGLPVRSPLGYQSGSVRRDGQVLAVADGAGVVRLVRLPEPVATDAGRVAGRAQGLAGLDLSAAGAVRSLGVAEWQARAAEMGAEERAPALAWHLARGLDRVEVGQWDAARWHLDRRLREQPDDWLALALRARALAHLGRLDEAAADFDRSFEKGPAETVFAWHLLAATQGGATFEEPRGPLPLKPRRLTAAAWFLKRLLERDAHGCASLLAQRARARVRQNQWDRARDDYERATRLAPEDVGLLQEAARASLQHQEPDRAADYFMKAAAARPDDDSMWLGAARELVRLERWDRAAEHFLHAIDLQPDENGVAAPRAVIYLELAHSPQAFDRAVQLRPNDRHLWIGRARYHVERGQWKEAAEDFARAAALSDIDERSYEYAAVLLVLGDEEGYRKVAARMVDRIGDTRDPFLAYVLARTCALAPKSVADPARAITWAGQAVAARADAGWYLHALGLALYRKGDSEAAVARLTESEKTEWVPVLNWLVLAMAHHRLGHAAEAAEYLRRATDFLDKGAPTKPFTAVLLSTDAEEAQVLRREAEELIRGKKEPR